MHDCTLTAGHGGGHDFADEASGAELPHAAPDLETAFASGARVRTAPCTADGHDCEHFQVRTNGHWLCGHLLASLLIAQGIVANPEPQPAPVSPVGPELPHGQRAYVTGDQLAFALQAIGTITVAGSAVDYQGNAFGALTLPDVVAELVMERLAAQEPKAAPEPPGLRAALVDAMLRWSGRDALDHCSSELAQILDQHPEPQPAPETAALDALEKVVASHERVMYAAVIDIRRGQPGAARRLLGEQLDGWDGPEWDGTETGAEYLDRTREDS